MIRAYCGERLTAERMAPLVLLLTTAAQAGRSMTLIGLGMDALMASLLSAQFRVWDDLADRDRDARSHPNRVLVRMTDPWPVKALCALLGVIGVAVIALRTSSVLPLVLLILLNAAVALCYATRGERNLASDQLLLARYAAFVLIISKSAGQARAFTLTLSMAAVFLALSIYEGLHDRTSPIARRPVVLTGESILLVGTLAVLGGHL
jgi:4-hydroxybenzoate polyprenyltransferase